VLEAFAAMREACAPFCVVCPFPEGENMPHAIIEYSANLRDVLRSAEVCAVVHNVLIQSGLFTTNDIKTRSYVAEDFLVGEKGSAGSFVHVRVYLFEGRTILQKQTLSESLRDALGAHLPTVDQISVDLREIVRDTYRKKVLALK
jgi:5-carboxymethyl-2-hydroxymuconate isomerase